MEKNSKMCPMCQKKMTKWVYGGGKRICTDRKCFEKARDNYVDIGTPYTLRTDLH